LSTPYSCRVENLTSRFKGPASAFSSTRFFFPLIYTCQQLSTTEVMVLPYTLEQKKKVPARFFSYIRGAEWCDGRHCRRGFRKAARCVEVVAALLCTPHIRGAWEG
jgi:hypothetical protein